MNLFCKLVGNCDGYVERTAQRIVQHDIPDFLMHAEKGGCVVHEACFLESWRGIENGLTETQIIGWGYNENDLDDKEVGGRMC